MILFINSSDFNSLQFALVDEDAKIFSSELAFNENYKTVEFLQNFLKKQKADMDSFTKIIVCSGPGSFNGIRVGVSLAQALGYALDIPVIAIPKPKVPQDLLKLKNIKLSEKLILHYGQKPNISTSKKRVP